MVIDHSPRKKVKLQIDPLFHPESPQDKPDPQKGHDIALLKLSEDVDFEIYTPACLPSDGADYTGQTGSVYGKVKKALWHIRSHILTFSNLNDCLHLCQKAGALSNLAQKISRTS